MADGSVVIDTRILDDGFKRGMKGLRSVAKAGGIAIAASIGAATVALGAYAVASVAAAEADQSANKRIEAVATSMGLYGDETAKVSKRLQDLATATALQTGVDDLAIKATQAKLLTFRELAKTADETGGAFDRATIAAIDLAAAGFGSAEQNAVQLGKALQDPVKGITALARSGVTFTEQEKDKIAALVESNKTLEAQELILKAIETQVGGTADATADSSARIEVALGELQEAAGGPLLSVFDALTPAIISSLTGLQPAFEETFGGLADIISGESGGEGRMQAGIQKLVESMGDALETALPVLITALVSIITALANELPGIIIAVTPALINGMLLIVDALPEILPPLLDALSFLIEAMATELGLAAPILIPPLLKALYTMAFSINKMIPAFVKAGLVLTGGMVVGIGRGFSAAIKDMPKHWRAVAQSWKLSDFLSAGKNIVAGIRQGIENAWSGLQAKLRSLAGALPDVVKRVLGIRSPSRVFAEEVGAPSADGIAMGFTDSMRAVYRRMQSSVNSEMARFASVVTPRAQSQTQAAAVAGGINVNFYQPVRTYSEVVMATRELGVAIARG